MKNTISKTELLLLRAIDECYDETGFPSDDQEALTFQDGLYKALSIIRGLKNKNKK